MSKKEFFNGCFPADWVEVDTKTEKEEVKQIQQRKDVATLLAELEEIKNDFENRSDEWNIRLCTRQVKDTQKRKSSLRSSAWISS